jgi:phosphotransferase system HPr (HPr) family protein
MQKITLQVVNDVGLHARPASEFVKLAGQFKARIQVRNATKNSSPVDAKSILSVLLLGVEKGHEIELTGEGEDEEKAIRALRELIESSI